MAKKEQKQTVDPMVNPLVDPEVYEILDDNDLERAQRILDLQRRLDRLEERVTKADGI